MRIDGYSQNLIETNTSKLERQEHADVGSSRGAAIADHKPKTDECTISAAAADGAEISRTRVAELRAQIASDTYDLNANNIADAMLKTFAK